jgi:hypothetical protein
VKKTNLLVTLALPLLVVVLALPGQADAVNPTTCKDGTTSAAIGRGACSGHGGVQKASSAATAPAATATPSGAMPQSAPAAAAKSTASASKPASAGNVDPTNATAKCKDGTYSKSKHRSGSCSHHGGVAEWLTAAP